MNTRKILIAGISAGLIMGIALFFTGAIASFLVYGPQFAPADKFEPDQINAWYFFWTKLVIGSVYGIIFGYIYSKFYLPVLGTGVLKGLLYGFGLWFLISLWNLSHPVVYGPFEVQDKLFWLVYTGGGFLAYGLALGAITKRLNR